MHVPATTNRYILLHVKHLLRSGQTGNAIAGRWTRFMKRQGGTDSEQSFKAGGMLETFSFMRAVRTCFP